MNVIFDRVVQLAQNAKCIIIISRVDRTSAKLADTIVGHVRKIKQPTKNNALDWVWVEVKRSATICHNGFGMKSGTYSKKAGLFVVRQEKS